MFPSDDEIRRAAFFRWQRRGCGHGLDCEDWLAAEQELLLGRNYEVTAHYVLDGTEARAIGDEGRRVCRFCELTEPATTFSEDRLAVPEFLGNRSLFTFEECDECHDRFAAGVDADLGRFVAAFRSGPAPSEIPVAAFKGLSRLALAVMPRGDLHFFEDALEWVGNPDHDFDAGLFGGLGAYLYPLVGALPHPWVALARRVDEEAPMPFMLAFVGAPGLVVQAAVPFSARDEDLEGRPVVVPDVADPVAVGHDPSRGPRAFLPVATGPDRSALRWRLDALVNPSPE